MRILVVEDTEDLADAIVHRLRKLGYGVDWAATGDEAEELLGQEAYQLILLDIMLPGTDGQTLLNRLRRRRDATPVLVMTARSQVDVRIGLLDLGADDFIVKPFDLRELEARCRALLRRSHGMASSVTVFGNLTFDAAARAVTVAGQPVELGGREFRLLELFLSHLNTVLSKDDLMDRLFSLDQPTALNAIELYVSRLRRKLEGASVEIRTKRGLGYVAELAGKEG
ncbi:two-component system response regulator TctD [Azospirillum fermentarium]|uniref:response regulator transcription factor n=1 Tax=Azospirillum fermentarium TaxID=1233114 RepID=UPI00222652CC|nr:response regulator transcription factor [Azospirillum fermentarium]MCW2247679.1 two-component system response regulator TctD [Azospirillum fermentarium]